MRLKQMQVAVSAVLLTATIFIAAEARAQTQAPASGAATEHLVMPQFPKGWTESSTIAGEVEVAEYIPRNQDAKTWTDKISIQVYHKAKDLPIDAYQRRAVAQTRATCDGVIEERLQTGVNNGYPAAFWRLWCKKDKEGNFGETIYTKAIQGTQELFILSRSWRMPPFGDDGPTGLSRQVSNDAISFLSSATLCTDGPPHPCPSPESPSNK
jgi:hypothetical protein